MSKKNEFYLVLPSNSCPNTQPSNNASKFIVDYPTSFTLDPDWEVALIEFNCLYSHSESLGDSVLDYVKTTPITFPMGFNYKNKVLIGEEMSHGFKLTLDDKQHLIVGHIRPFTLRFKTQQDAEKCGYKKKNIKSHTKFTVIGDTPMQNDIKISFMVETSEADNENGSILFNEGMAFARAEELGDFFSKKCSNIFEHFGVGTNRKTGFYLHSNIVEIRMDNKLAKLLGFKQTRFVNKGQFHEGEYKPLLKGSYDNYYIYSSIVDPIFVGSDRVPLLRNLWLENKNEYDYGDVVYLSIDHPMYLPLSSTVINKIEINIRDDSGQFIDFIPNSKTSLTLHFRKNE